MEKQAMQQRQAQPQKTQSPENASFLGDAVGNQARLAMMTQFYEQARQEGRPRELSEQLRQHFANYYGPAMRQVKVFENPRLNEVEEKGIATGDEIHLAVGSFAPQSSAGMKLLDHEMRHIAQQNSGMAMASGMVTDTNLERAADGAGVAPAVTAASLSPAGGAAIQGAGGAHSEGRIMHWLRKCMGKIEAQLHLNAWKSANKKDNGGLGMLSEDLLMMDYRQRLDSSDSPETTQRKAGRKHLDSQIGSVPQTIEKDGNLPSLNQGMSRLGDAQYKTALNEIQGELRQYNSNKQLFAKLNARKRSGDVSEGQKSAHKQCMQALFAMQKKLLQINDKDSQEGRPTSPSVLKILDRIQQEYAEQVQWQIKSGMNLYTGNAAVDADENLSGQANSAWQGIQSGSGPIQFDGLSASERAKAGNDATNSDIDKKTKDFKDAMLPHFLRLLSLPSGVRLMQNLQNHAPAPASPGEQQQPPRTITLRPNPNGSAQATGVDDKGTGLLQGRIHDNNFQPEGAAGKGTSSKVNMPYNSSNALDSHMGRRLYAEEISKHNGNPNAQFSNEKNNAYPIYYLMAHELIHTDHNLTGTNRNMMKFEDAGGDKQKLQALWRNPEERMTVAGINEKGEQTNELSENSFRDDLELTKRTRYQ